MTYASPASIYEEPEQSTALAPVDLVFVPRSRNQWLGFLPGLLVCGMSWMAGGVPALTDMGFLLFTIVCGMYLAAEFFYFPRRFGIGGLVLYGGTLCWFCQDYFTNWFGIDFKSGLRLMPVESWVVAKAAFLHVLFIMLMSISLNWTVGRWMEKLILLVPEPGNPNIYLVIVLVLFCFTLCPYFIFNAEPTPICIYHALFSGWTGPPQLWVYRTGNLNYSWGAYVAQIMQVGEVGGIVAIIYAILIARNWFTRFLGFFIWLFNAMIAFETGRRGNIAFHLLPPIAMLFIKFQAKAAALFKRFSVRSYLICGLLSVAMLWIVHFQGTFRGTEGGYSSFDASKINITENQGNTMFTEGLIGYSRVGVDMPFFYAQDFPGEGAILAIPHTVFDLVIGVIPRALWHDKPVDALWSWYNREYTGVGNGVDGTTIAHGLIGGWYFKYGLGGMIEGAFLVGWLMGASERALQHSEGNPIGMLMSLAFATWIFRTYRDFIFIDLYGLILGGITLTIIVPILRSVMGGGSASPPQSA
jgi:hypothetical protein